MFKFDLKNSLVKGAFAFFSVGISNFALGLAGLGISLEGLMDAFQAEPLMAILSLVLMFLLSGVLYLFMEDNIKL